MEENKKETLGEASIRLVPNRTLKTPFGSPYEITPTRERNTFKKGAKWQSERMYSEEEVLDILYQWSMYKIDIELERLADELPNILPYNEWFKKHKKK
jgi:hypothetical protein